MDEMPLFEWAESQGESPKPHFEDPASPTVLIFDCETTGTDRAHDQIIELCIQRGLPGVETPGPAPGEGGLDDGPTCERRTWRIKPTAAIHPGAQAVHGIKQEDLADCPAFAEVADEIAEAFASADVIVGYNVVFDIEMLQAEYARIGRAPLDFTSKKIVDAFRLWQQCEPRSLQHAHQRFVGNAFEAAHTASADVAATGRVLVGMLRTFSLDGQNWDEIATKAAPRAAADPPKP